MRPDEYARQDAERWTEAVQLRNAINQERDRVHGEAGAIAKNQRVNHGDAG